MSGHGPVKVGSRSGHGQPVDIGRRRWSPARGGTASPAVGGTGDVANRGKSISQ